LYLFLYQDPEIFWYNKILGNHFSLNGPGMNCSWNKANNLETTGLAWRPCTNWPKMARTNFAWTCRDGTIPGTGRNTIRSLYKTAAPIIQWMCMGWLVVQVHTDPCTIIMAILFQRLTQIPRRKLALPIGVVDGGTMLALIPASTVINYHRMILFLWALQIYLSICRVSVCVWSARARQAHRNKKMIISNWD